MEGSLTIVDICVKMEEGRWHIYFQHYYQHHLKVVLVEWDVEKQKEGVAFLEGNLCLFTEMEDSRGWGYFFHKVGSPTVIGCE